VMNGLNGMVNGVNGVVNGVMQGANVPNRMMYTSQPNRMMYTSQPNRMMYTSQQNISDDACSPCPDCSTCGLVFARNVTCQNASGTVVDDSKCKSDKPSETYSCAPCDTSWNTGDWTQAIGYNIPYVLAVEVPGDPGNKMVVTVCNNSSRPVDGPIMTVNQVPSTYRIFKILHADDQAKTGPVNYGDVVNIKYGDNYLGIQGQDLAPVGNNAAKWILKNPVNKASTGYIPATNNSQNLGKCVLTVASTGDTITVASSPNKICTDPDFQKNNNNFFLSTFYKDPQTTPDAIFNFALSTVPLS